MMAGSETADAMALPLWINGHAYLTLASGFFDLCSPASGAPLRRVPLCGVGEALEALRAAQQALAGWSECGRAQRAAVLARTGEALKGYAGHFAGLILIESGCRQDEADLEVAQSVALFKDMSAAMEPIIHPDVLAVVGCDSSPLLGVLAVAAPALAAGACLIVKPALQTASIMVALAELLSRNGLPDGVFNVVHGDQAMVSGLRAAGVKDIRPGAGKHTENRGTRSVL